VSTDTPTTTKPRAGDWTDAVACEDFDRNTECRRPKIWLVESGGYDTHGQFIGAVSCDTHLADTVRAAACCYPLVRVMPRMVPPYLADAVGRASAAFIAARGSIKKREETDGRP
jgi:hypothetical protein